MASLNRQSYSALPCTIIRGRNPRYISGLCRQPREFRHQIRANDGSRFRSRPTAGCLYRVLSKVQLLLASFYWIKPTFLWKLGNCRMIPSFLLTKQISVESRIRCVCWIHVRRELWVVRRSILKFFHNYIGRIKWRTCPAWSYTMARDHLRPHIQRVEREEGPLWHPGNSTTDWPYYLNIVA